MVDVYFVTRYVQLRDRTDFPPERGTRALIEHLGSTGALSEGHASALYDGYSTLRGVDHYLRLVGDRLAPRLPEEAEPLEEIALEDAEPFDCSRTATRHPRETKGLDYDVTTEPQGSCCEPGACC